MKIKFLPVLILIIFGAIDIFGYFFVNPKPMYFRAWEKALNDGKNSYYAPFKPLVTYDGPMKGDLLNKFNFVSTDIRHQKFISDEYGFRNSVGHSVQNKIVLIGTSFVGGAALSQEELLSTILEQKYKLKTYNYATLPLQHFYEDSRFIKNPPKYVVIVGSEFELLQNSWIEVLNESTLVHDVTKYKTFDSWQIENQSYFNTFEYKTADIKRFSIVRHYLRQVYVGLLNKLFSRQTIASINGQSQDYQVDLDNLFFLEQDASLALANELGKNIPKTADTLKKTQEILSKRNISLIVAVIPSKESLYLKKFKDVKQKLAPNLEKALESKGIKIVKTYDYLDKAAKNGALVYYKDDGHFTVFVNNYLAGKISKIINNSEQ